MKSHYQSCHRSEKKEFSKARENEGKFSFSYKKSLATIITFPPLNSITSDLFIDLSIYQGKLKIRTTTIVGFKFCQSASTTTKTLFHPRTGREQIINKCFVKTLASNNEGTKSPPSFFLSDI